MATIAVAGAAGFVGSALIEQLCSTHQVVALTRGKLAGHAGNAQLTWRTCDLFSLTATEAALQGCDTAVYLIHSMLPAAHLTQGRFEDLDLLVADNFARAAAAAGVQHIIYLGGIIPEDVELSRHLRSRLEVEQVLGAYGARVTALRAAIIFGPGGSSMNIMARLVRRLPVMVCPAWTSTRSRPIFLGDVLAAIEYCVANPQVGGRVYDLGGDTVVTYREMMEAVGAIRGRKPKVFSVPLLSPKISRLWVSVITGAPKNLVAPLIESLAHDMVPRPDRDLRIPGHRYLSFQEMLSVCFSDSSEDPQPRAFVLPDDERLRTTVRSVQRLHLPEKMTAPEAAALYVGWLAKHLHPALRAKRVEADVAGTLSCEFYLTGIRAELLGLEMDQRQTAADRAEFQIVAGLLLKGGDHGAKGRLEFRRFSQLKCLLVAIHDFRPRLPWYVYIWTQAKLHLYIMGAFDRFLRRYSH